MKQFDINDVMKELVRTNPNGFINECHFQVEFGYALKRAFPRFDIHYEWSQNKKRVDVFAQDKKERIGFEFKYYTTKKEIVLNHGLKVVLKNQNNADLHRIGFWKDVKKLEGLIARGKIDKGYCLFLTNDAKVFLPVPEGNADVDYDLSDGLRPMKNKLEHLTRDGSKNYSVELSKIDYEIKNKPYCPTNSSFRIVVLPID